MPFSIPTTLLVILFFLVCLFVCLFVLFVLFVFFLQNAAVSKEMRCKFSFSAYLLRG